MVVKKVAIPRQIHKEESIGEQDRAYDQSPLVEIGGQILCHSGDVLNLYTAILLGIGHYYEKCVYARPRRDFSLGMTWSERKVDWRSIRLLQM